MGSTAFQRRAESNWAELEGSMMSKALKRGEQAEERPRCSVEIKVVLPSLTSAANKLESKGSANGFSYMRT